MLVVPVVMPDNAPVADPMVATEIALLIQVPPADGSVSVIVAPAHNADGPAIVPGNGLTVMVAVLKQPPGDV
jgi:hypothetical protein